MAHMWQKPKAKANLMDFVHRTTMCKFYQSGRCNKGTQCTFAHSEDQLQSQPDLYKTSLCSKFTRKGFCKNGDSCKYAHGKDELRQPGAMRSSSMWHEEDQAIQDVPVPQKQDDFSQSFAQEFAQDFAENKGFSAEIKERRQDEDEELSSDGTCTPSPYSSTSLSASLWDWSPQSSVMSEEHVRLKNTFLEFGYPSEPVAPMRRSSSVPDLGSV